MINDTKTSKKKRNFFVGNRTVNEVLSFSRLFLIIFSRFNIKLLQKIGNYHEN